MKSLIPLMVMMGLMYVLVLWIKSKTKTGKSKKRQAPRAADREAEMIEAAKAQFSKKSESAEAKTPAAGERWPVRQKRTLLTNSEKEMFDRLQDALYEHIVLPQVALSQIIECEDGNFGTTWNKINRKVCDYVVCDKDFSVVAVIELDGWSHKYEKQQQKDADKDAAVTSAGLKIVRFDARMIPKGPEIRERLGIVYQ